MEYQQLSSIVWNDVTAQMVVNTVTLHLPFTITLVRVNEPSVNEGELCGDNGEVSRHGAALPLPVHADELHISLPHVQLRRDKRLSVV